MRISEYVRYDGLGLADLVAKKEVHPTELLTLAIARCDETDPALNAVIIRMDEEARQRATTAELKGPFAGVPFLLKDLYQEYAGVMMSNGNQALKQARYTPDYHAEITRRWLDAGVVMFGRTSSSEFGLKAVTETDAWQATRNPWHTQHTPGGSSGGSAAAVAAGIVPIAGASDAGGSIRIPASCCGLFGLKPSRGRTPWGPLLTEQLHGASVNHVLTRSVRDSAAMLDATAGDEVGAPFRLRPPERSYLEEVGVEPARLKIAFSTASPVGTLVDPEARRAVEKTAHLLTSLGHHVEEAQPDIDGMRAAESFLTLWFARAALTIKRVQKLISEEQAQFELETRVAAAFGHAASAASYAEACHHINLITRKLGEFFSSYDLWLTPTTAMPPDRIGETAPNPIKRLAMQTLLASGQASTALKLGIPQKLALQSLQRVPFTQIANITGVPAMSVPLHQTADGLPMGVQFIAGAGQEGLLFQIAGQLERAQPWPHTAPFIHA